MLIKAEKYDIVTAAANQKRMEGFGVELFKEIACCVFLFVFGLLMLIKPEFVWKIDHFLSVKNGEPTELYLAVARISGLAFIAIAIGGACVFFVFS